MNRSPHRPNVLLLCLTFALTATAQKVTTSQYGNDRNGANTLETKLTPANVNARQFGKLYTLKVDGDVFAQPLFVPGLQIPHKGRHDVVFIATEHDSVYAFDAFGHPAEPLWHVSLLQDGTTPVGGQDVQCPFISPEIGITSTPVIDTATNTIYVLARTRKQTGPRSADYQQTLHALTLTTGVPAGASTDIQASLRGTGDGSRSGSVAFDPLRENPRAALMLNNGLVYLTWASSCDVGPYHGWIMAYDAHTLQQKAVFNASPDADDSGIWASDTGPVADEGGNVIVATGNGLFDAGKGGRDYGDSLLKLDGQSLKLADYFTPFDARALNARDNDLGSGGPILLPTQHGPHPHLLAIAGKDGTIYLVARDHMGHYQPHDNTHAVQTIPTNGGVFGSMAYWNHNFYVLSDSEKDALRQFSVQDGRLLLKAASGAQLQSIDATPTISANGSKDGVLWFLRSKAWDAREGTAALYAFDAADVRRQLYNSEQNAPRDRAGPAIRFNIPTVANGHVYVGAGQEVDVYGLLKP